jgi:hypothetical protein
MDDDFTRLDDTALLAWRAQARAELERLPPYGAEHDKLTVAYDQSTAELTERARRAWMRTS